LPAYQYLKSENEGYPIATQLQSEILSLPIYPELTEDEIEYVANSIKDFYSNEA
jgi:dTDP-4-amino-4,6-dideoxygalactose transaminase